MEATRRAGLAHAVAPAVGRRTGGAGWWGAGAALVVVGWGANQFVALLTVYHQALGITDLADDLAVAVYALGLVPALLATAALHERVRRRRVAMAALGCTAVSSAVMIAATSGGAAALLAGRVIAGAGTGVALSGLTGWTRELSSPPHSSTADPHAGARRTVVCLSVGFAGGPLVAGLLAQCVPGPLVAPYLAHLLATALVLPAVLQSPETLPVQAARVPRRGDRSPWRDRRVWRAQAPVAPWVFAAAMTSIVVVGRLAGEGPLVTGAIAALTLLVGAVVQPVARRVLSGSGALVTGAGLGAVAVGLLVAALVSNGGVVVAICAAVLLGAGYGLCHLAGLVRATSAGHGEVAAAATATFYALAYLGIGVPVLLTWLAGLVGYDWVLVGSATAAVLTAVVQLAWRTEEAATL